MGLFAEDQALRLQEKNLTAVVFNNLFVGSDRIFEFESGHDKYQIFLQPKISGLDAKILLKLKMGGLDTEVVLSCLPDLGKINQYFENIDFMLFDEDIRKCLLNAVFENDIARLVAEFGLNIEMQDICFSDLPNEKFQNEIGVSILKNNFLPINFNMRLNDDLLNIFNSKFEKISPNFKEISDDFVFEWYLEAGKTDLPIEDCRLLQINDIVFLDECAQVASGEYRIKGFDGVDCCAELNGNKLVVKSIEFFN